MRGTVVCGEMRRRVARLQAAMLERLLVERGLLAEHVVVVGVAAQHALPHARLLLLARSECLNWGILELDMHLLFLY